MKLLPTFCAAVLAAFVLAAPLAHAQTQSGLSPLERFSASVDKRVAEITTAGEAWCPKQGAKEGVCRKEVKAFDELAQKVKKSMADVQKAPPSKFTDAAEAASRELADLLWGYQNFYKVYGPEQ